MIPSLESLWHELLPGGASGKRRCHSLHPSGSSSQCTRWEMNMEAPEQSAHDVQPVQD